MARARTLSDMRGQARAYADATVSRNTTDAEANTWINQSLALLWGKLTTLDAQRYMVTTGLSPDGSLEYDFTDATVFSPTAGDFMSLVGVDWMASGGRYPLDPFAINDRAVGSLNATAAAPVFGVASRPPRYAVRGQGLSGSGARLVFDSVPTSGRYEVHYIQAPQTLDNDLASFDGVAGFEEWVVLDVAILMLQREESDPSVLMRRQQQVEAQIMTLGAKRDAGRAHVPAKVYGRRNRGRRGVGSPW